MSKPMMTEQESEEFVEFVKWASAEVDKWPKWKLIGSRIYNTDAPASNDEDE